MVVELFDGEFDEIAGRHEMMMQVDRPMVAALAEVSLPCLPADANLDFVVATAWYGMRAAASQIRSMSVGP